MDIGIPREIKDQEHRVAMIPGGVRALTRAGHTVFLEKSAGHGSGISDEEYLQSGATILNDAAELYERSGLILKVKEPLPVEYPHLREGQILFTFLHLAANPALTRVLIAQKVTAIAYETVEGGGGTLPILIPMSEVAGRMAVIIGTQYLQKRYGGSGILLGGVPGVEPGRVLILGSGTVGRNAARVAVGLGAQVILMNPWIAPLQLLDELWGGRVMTLAMNDHNVEGEAVKADLVIGAVLIPGARSPYLVSKETVSRMKKGSVIVDVSIDQGGCVETSRPTTHSDPVFEVNGVLHYCVANIPGIVPRTATYALSNITLPYVIRLADLGVVKACREDAGFSKGLNVYQGKMTHPSVAEALGMSWVSLPE
jgi:alanine dehydrogenase